MAAGSTFGTLFRITGWGESHGEGLGVVVDGCPAGLALCEEDIQKYLDRRRPGRSQYNSGRMEGDQVKILSGLFQGRTTGAPVSMIFCNHDQRSEEYSAIRDIYRPGHADYTYEAKYGFRDYRGGGRASGRETIARVAAGALAARVLDEMGIRIYAYTRSIGPVTINEDYVSIEERDRNGLYMPDAAAAREAAEFLHKCMKDHDSAGGVIECRIEGLPAGLGDPVFDKISSLLGQAVLSIGSVKGFEIGDGFRSASGLGSANNDPFYMDGDKVKKRSNHAGGVLGGISDGSPLVFRAAVKPTPSIGRPQETVDRTGNETTITIQGRHDPVIVPRVVVVVEAMAACVVLDRLLVHMSSRLDRIIDFYRKE